MKFKRTAVILLSLIMMLAAGCRKTNIVENKPNDDFEGNITVWATKENSNYIKYSIDNYKKVHEKIHIDLIEMDKGDMESKLQVEIEKKGSLPDVICVEDEDVQALFKKLSASFENTSDDIKKENYLKYKIDNLTYQGNLLGVPLNSKPAVMVYRTDILETAKINSEYIKTWEDFIDAGKLLNVSSKLMIALPLEDERTYRIYLSELGGSYFDKEGRISVNSQKCIKALEILKRMYSSQIVQNVKNDDEALNLLKQGKTAAAIVSPEEVTSVLKNSAELKGKLRLMRLPAFEEGGNQSVSFNGSNLMIIGTSKNKKAAIDFTKYTTENKENLSVLMKGTGMFPAYSYNYDEKWFKVKDSFFDDQKPYFIYSNTAKEINGFNYNEAFSKITGSVKDAYSSVVLKGQDIKITLDDLQKRMETAK
ncbi:ABC transporter, solute-binding protein [Clostridiales bacterium oral taxon 876 str. F0540]|nr:ABC transporter, solute-binding protein [Clostridiales bacterium oral taxon 876 str. F0540]